MITGCETLSEVNFTLRQEQELARVWGGEQIADQSTLSRTLDQLSLAQIDELRAATTQIWHSFSQITRHNWHAFLWSDVFPGNYHTVHCLQPAVQSVEIALDLAPEQHSRIAYRLYGGSDSEAEMQELVASDYHILAKGINHNRANKLAKQVERWDFFGEDWLGEVEPPTTYARPVRVLFKRQIKADGLHHSYYLTTLAFSSKKNFLTLYNARGGAEVEQFREDKNGQRPQDPARPAQRWTVPASPGGLLLV
jgi:hypothetical protein